MQSWTGVPPCPNPPTNAQTHLQELREPRVRGGLEDAQQGGGQDFPKVEDAVPRERGEGEVHREVVPGFWG